MRIRMKIRQAKLEVESQRQRDSVTKADDIEMDISVTDLKWNSTLN
jgi:hypothetical protein